MIWNHVTIWQQALLECAMYGTLQMYVLCWSEIWDGCHVRCIILTYGPRGKWKIILLRKYRFNWSIMILAKQRLKVFSNTYIWNHKPNETNHCRDGPCRFPLSTSHSNSLKHHPRWYQLLNIEISSNVQECYIIFY